MEDLLNGSADLADDDSDDWYKSEEQLAQPLLAIYWCGQLGLRMFRPCWCDVGLTDSSGLDLGTYTPPCLLCKWLAEPKAANCVWLTSHSCRSHAFINNGQCVELCLSGHPLHVCLLVHLGLACCLVHLHSCVYCWL
jgi:hypothetical protein